MSLKYALLTVLTEGQAVSGYDLLEYFDGSVGFVWHATPPQIYRELDALSRAEMVTHELVVQTGRPNKKLYSITDLGRQALFDWVETPSPIQMVKDGMLLRTFSYGHIDPKLAVARLTENRTLYEERLALYGEIRERVEATFDGPTRVGYLLVLDAGVLHAEASIAWCDRAIHTFGGSKPTGSRRR